MNYHFELHFLLVLAVYALQSLLINSPEHPDEVQKAKRTEDEKEDFFKKKLDDFFFTIDGCQIGPCVS